MKGVFAVMWALIIGMTVYGLIDVDRISTESYEAHEDKPVLSFYEEPIKYMGEQQNDESGQNMKPKIDFDLTHLSIVRQEGEEDGVINSGTHSDGESAGEPATVTENSGRDESGTRGYSDDNSGNEYSVGESVGSEVAEPELEQWDKFEDIVFEDGDGESMSELVESEPELSAEESHDAEYKNGDNGQYESEIDSGLTYLGDWTITAYCPCEICCGQWATGYTASGTLATSNHTVACGVLPFGTQVMIGDQIYTVEDTGVEGEWIDIFFDTHDEALAFGMRTMEVYLVE